MGEMILMLFPLLLTAVVVLGYCLVGVVGAKMAWIYAIVIVLVLLTTSVPPDDPKEET